MQAKSGPEISVKFPRFAYTFALCIVSVLAIRLDDMRLLLLIFTELFFFLSSSFLRAQICKS